MRCDGKMTDRDEWRRQLRFMKTSEAFPAAPDGRHCPKIAVVGVCKILEMLRVALLPFLPKALRSS